MMTSQRSLSVFLLFILPLSGVLSAQYTEAGIDLGISSYWGDLSLPTNFDNLTRHGRLAVGLKGRYIHQKNWGASVYLGYSTLYGNDANSASSQQKSRNLNFTTPLWELGILGELYPLGYGKPMGDLHIYPFLTAGLSVIHFNPYTYYLGDRYDLKPLGTEGQGLPGYEQKYSRWSMAIPIGGGFKWELNEDWSINTEAIVSRAFTDYLDDVSGKYADHDALLQSNGQIAAALANRTQEYSGSEFPVIYPMGTQRGSNRVKDYFMHITIGVHMRITDMLGRVMAFRGRIVKCPDF
jgi:hypothetical protein